MGPAIGGSSSTSKPAHGALWVDVRDFGAKADDGITDNAGPIQAAIDALAARLQGSSSKGVVFIPGAPKAYYVTKSIWVDSSNIEIRGEGQGSQVRMGPDRHSVFIFGVRRVETVTVNNAPVTYQIDASNRPDLFGKLDQSVVSAPGHKWGIRTNGNSFVQFQACPFSAGVVYPEYPAYSDNWGDTSQLTIEFCIEPGNGSTFGFNAPLFGAAENQPTPLFIKNWDEPNKFLVMFRTSDMSAQENTDSRWFSFKLGSATPPYRVAIQLDLVNAVCTAFVNGVQVALADPRNLDPAAAIPFKAGTGLTFIRNEFQPFMVGQMGPGGGSVPADMQLYGLRLSNTIRYQNRGPGQSQVRVDAPATPINDAWAYFGNDANTVAFLEGTDAPATSGRVVSVRSGGAAFSGLSSGVFRHTTATAVGGNVIRDIAVIGNAPYGQAIALGGVLDMTVENVAAYNAYHGIGSINIGANYMVRLRNCILDGTDSGYYSFMQLLVARDISFLTSARVAARHVSSGARWDDVIVVRPTPVTDYIFKAIGSDYGGNFNLSNWVIDFEGDPIGQAGIYCESHLTPATSLQLTDIYFGTTGTAPLVQLRDKYVESASWHKCWLNINNMTAWSPTYLAAIDVDGPLWSGELNGVGLDGNRFIHRQRFGTRTGIVVREVAYIGPPRSLYWYAGAHVLDVRCPADGQFTQWRCTHSGTYGTPDPPLWIGIDPLTVAGNGLAAYVMNHAYMTVNLG